MSDCLFCRSSRGEIPASIVYEDDRVVAFNDINPQAPLHALVVPRRHIASLNTLVGRRRRTRRTRSCGARPRLRATRVTRTAGFRTVFNTNADAGQTVFHIHLHLLGGRRLAGRPDDTNSRGHNAARLHTTSNWHNFQEPDAAQLPTTQRRLAVLGVVQLRRSLELRL